MPEHVLVNLRDSVVELHLPDRVAVLAPWESVPETGPSDQVDELVRRGLVERRPADADAGGDTSGEAPAEADADGPQEASPAASARPRRTRTRPAAQ